MGAPREDTPMDGRSGRSSRSCRERAELLLQAADDAASPAAAAALRGQAQEWRKLAIEAAWQEAFLIALSSVGEPGEPEV